MHDRQCRLRGLLHDGQLGLRGRLHDGQLGLRRLLDRQRAFGGLLHDRQLALWGLLHDRQRRLLRALLDDVRRAGVGRLGDRRLRRRRVSRHLLLRLRGRQRDAAEPDRAVADVVDAHLLQAVALRLVLRSVGDRGRARRQQRRSGLHLVRPAPALAAGEQEHAQEDRHHGDRRGRRVTEGRQHMHTVQPTPRPGRTRRVPRPP